VIPAYQLFAGYICNVPYKNQIAKKQQNYVNAKSLKSKNYSFKSRLPRTGLRKTIGSPLLLVVAKARLAGGNS